MSHHTFVSEADNHSTVLQLYTLKVNFRLPLQVTRWVWLNLKTINCATPIQIIQTNFGNVC